MALIVGGCLNRQDCARRLYLMNNDRSRSKNSKQTTLLVMGFIWIACALFGLIFDPEKKVIIISLFAIGGLCSVVYIVTKLKKK